MNYKTKLNLYTLATTLILVRVYFLGSLYPDMLGIISMLMGIGVLLFISVYDFIKNPYDKKTIVYISIILVLLLISFYFSHRFKLVMVLLACTSLKDIDFDDFIKRDLYVRLFLFILQLIIYFSITKDFSFIYNLTFDREVYYSLGFDWKNSLALYILMMIFDYLYIKKDNKNIYKYVLSVLLLVIMYVITGCRTDLIVGILGVFLFIISDYKFEMSKLKITSFIIRNLFIILTIVTLICIAIYNGGSEVGLWLNRKFSGRLYLCGKGIEDYGISLFGSNVATSSSVNASEAPIIDIGYIWWVLKYGVISLLIFAGLYNITFRKLINRNEKYKIVLLVCLLLLGLMETHFMYFERNTYVVLLYEAVFIFNNNPNLKLKDLIDLK